MNVMEKIPNNGLRNNEHVLWGGKTQPFPLLDSAGRFKLLARWILTVILSAALLVLYLHNNDNPSKSFVVLVAAIAAVIVFSPLAEWYNLQAQQYWISDQRAVLMTRNKTIYSMELSRIDDFEVAHGIADQECLILGSCLFGEARKQPRWRSIHPKVDQQASDSQSHALGMIFYCPTDINVAAALLKARIGGSHAA